MLTVHRHRSRRPGAMRSWKNDLCSFRAAVSQDWFKSTIGVRKKWLDRTNGSKAAYDTTAYNLPHARWQTPTPVWWVCRRALLAVARAEPNQLPFPSPLASAAARVGSVLGAPPVTHLQAER